MLLRCKLHLVTQVEPLQILYGNFLVIVVCFICHFLLLKLYTDRVIVFMIQRMQLIRHQQSLKH